MAGLGWVKALLARKGHMPEPGLSGPYLINADYKDGWWDWVQMRNPSPGAFPYGGNLYWILIDYGNYYRPRILKSTDQGATWSFLTYFGSGANPEEWTYYSVRAGSTSNVRIVQWGSDSGGDIVLWDFDMVMEAVSLVDDSESERIGEDVSWLHYNHVTGEDIVFTEYGAITCLRRFSGGTWQSPQDIITAPYSTLNRGIRAVTDTTGVTHLFSNQEGATDTRLYYCQLAADGSLGSTQLIHSLNVNGRPADFYRAGQPAIINDTVVYPATSYSAFFFGTPLSAPAFTLLNKGNNCYDASASTNNVYNLPGTTGRIWWMDHNVSDDSGKLISSTYDGSVLGAPETVHDEYVSPSVPGAPYQYIFSLTQPIQLISGKWGFVFSLYDMDGDDADYYWEWQPLTATVSGTIVFGKSTAGINRFETQGFVSFG